MKLNYRKDACLPISKLSGQAIVEMIVSIALAAIIIAGITQIVTASIKANQLNKHKTQALNLAQGGMEITRNIRDNNWDNLANLEIDIGYHPVQGIDGWTLASGSEIIGQFTRAITIQNVYRGGDNNIVELGETPDPESRKITSQVSWQEKGKDYNISLMTYLVNWR